MASAKPQSAFLSPLDQYMPRTNTSIILLFETADPTKAVEILKAGLMRLNQRLPYLRGRVFATEADTESRSRLAIKWSTADKDVEMIEMRVEGHEAENIVCPRMNFKKLREEGAPLHYFPRCIMPLPAVTDLQSSPDAPVFGVSYTLMDGGVALGLCVQHGVMDGTGVVELIRYWADCTRSDDLSIISGPDGEEPLHRDRLLRLATQRAETTEDGASQHLKRPFRELLSSHPEFSLLSELGSTADRPAPPPSPTGACKIFTFDGSKLDAVKTALRASRATSLGAEWVTTNSVLCAIMWSCVTRVRAARREGQGGLGTSVSKLGFAVNGRTRLPSGSALAARPFLGNVNLLSMAKMDVSAVGKAGLECGAAVEDGVSSLAQAVEEIAMAIKRVTPGCVAEVMDLIDQAPDITDVSTGWNSFHTLDLTITSWANMGLYDADFGDGVGKPELMRVPWMMVDGLLIVLPRKRSSAESRLNNGTKVAAVESIEVIAVLHPEDIATLEKDAVWASYLI
ncbi:Trichothecene 3-O-acetyltransferase [Madurella mycetomatis]|uniref:Trichothecene 3-O-acetyltransferase n=1 Tax=Madurella mycetomatis TaxID=100816 RepID=A0A175VYG4_9PEZI|nr:Trichothecene 3-O-acetyltransferase [Madurella mycetomatis]